MWRWYLNSKEEVPGCAGWDRKKSSEPNLHVCGEDERQRVVYKLKEEYAKGIGTKKKKEKKKKNKDKEKEEKESKQNGTDDLGKTIVVPTLNFQYTRDCIFFLLYTKVNPILYTHALQIILFGSFYVRTQHCYGSLRIASLHKALAIWKHLDKVWKTTFARV